MAAARSSKSQWRAFLFTLVERWDRQTYRARDYVRGPAYEGVDDQTKVYRYVLLL